jgi:hypothetical protein
VYRMFEPLFIWDWCDCVSGTSSFRRLGLVQHAIDPDRPHASTAGDANHAARVAPEKRGAERSCY